MNEILDYVKALSDPVRLQIVGLLSQENATRQQIAARLNLSPRDSLTHLGFLESIGVISQADGVFALNEDKLATIGKEKLFGEAKKFTPSDELDETSKKILRDFLNPDGTIRQVPEQKKIGPILGYLIQNFEFDKTYAEREVNAIIKRFNEDTAGLRRDLVDAGLLARESDGSKYWRARNGS
ncbi:MAG: DUF2087 domain-containing protein [Anaerolineales bacterium]|jgi:hypothetical protein|nr:DUF2087 domain-containing protein [Anaerolineales bacterium]MCC6986771.1 DUF2087 domain-containing protein [Anaerolineales bacterium]